MFEHQRKGAACNERCLSFVVSLGNNQYLARNELYGFLVRVNEATDNNLFVSLATCYGAYIFNTLEITKRAPFAGYVGPVQTIKAVSLLADFQNFYRELLRSYDINKAVAVLNAANPEVPYRGNAVENIYRETFKSWLARYQDENFMAQKKLRYSIESRPME